MKRRWICLLGSMGLAVIMTMALLPPTRAADGGYTLVRGVADQNGAFVAQNSTYQLRAVVGQPLAGLPQAGSSWLGAEYWYATLPTVALPNTVYVPLITR